MHFLMFRETQPAKYLSIYLEIVLQTFLRNWPLWSQGLASLKLAWWATRLEIHARMTMQS